MVGGKLKSTSGQWNSPNVGATNSSGFFALPNGFRSYDFAFYSKSISSAIWTSNENSITTAISRAMDNSHSSILRYFDPKTYGLSIRCMKD